MGKGKGESDNIFSASQSSVFSPLRRLLRRISRLIELEKGEREDDDEEAFVVRKTGPLSLSLPCTYDSTYPLLFFLEQRIYLALVVGGKERDRASKESKQAISPRLIGHVSQSGGGARTWILQSFRDEKNRICKYFFFGLLLACLILCLIMYA